VIKKVVLPDAATCCMKPDLQVILLVDAVKSNPKNKGQTWYSVLEGVSGRGLCITTIAWESSKFFFREGVIFSSSPESQLLKVLPLWAVYNCCPLLVPSLHASIAHPKTLCYLWFSNDWIFGQIVKLTVAFIIIYRAWLFSEVRIYYRSIEIQ
jgi:hypothetical protein